VVVIAVAFVVVGGMVVAVAFVAVGGMVVAVAVAGVQGQLVGWHLGMGSGCLRLRVVVGG
jgi:hypothetical protein